MDEINALVRRHKLDVDDYHRMAEAGILAEDDRVELIEGDIIDMAPIGEDHAATVGVLTGLLVRAFGERAIVWPQNPVRLDRMSEPQPDFTVLRPRADGYRNGMPGPTDVLLLIEVADSSLRFDRAVKLPLYARAGIAEVWIIDLRRRVLLAHREPADGAFGRVSTHARDELVSPALAPDLLLPLDKVFG